MFQLGRRSACAGVAASHGSFTAKKLAIPGRIRRGSFAYFATNVPHRQAGSSACRIRWTWRGEMLGAVTLGGPELPFRA